MNRDQLKDTVKGDAGSRFAPKPWLEALKALAVFLILIGFLAALVIIAEFVRQL